MADATARSASRHNSDYLEARELAPHNRGGMSTSLPKLTPTWSNHPQQNADPHYQSNHVRCIYISNWLTKG
jgi:hypothetical protein